MADEKFVFDSLQDSETITDFLGALTKGFQKGSLTLSTNGETIELIPTGLLNFTVKAKKKADISKISITIIWKSPDAQNGHDVSLLRVE